jgi:beta-N-acetylhexosaminidase
MEGAATAGGITERARAALSAGCDMVLVCNAPQSAERLLAELKVVQKADSAGRILRLFHGAAPDWDALQASVDYGTARNLVRKIS